MRFPLLILMLMGRLIASDAALLACELPASPGTEDFLRFTLDPRESIVRFDAEAGLHTFTGTASKLSGRVRLPTPFLSARAEACVEIDAASLTTGIGMRDERMRKNHLDIDRFPSIVFAMNGVNQIEPLGGGRYGATLHGVLTLHGVTRPLAVPSRARLSSTLIEIEGTTPLRLSAFQIPIPSFLFISMKDEVLVTFKVRAVPE